jgi:hypothetical protein
MNNIIKTIKNLFLNRYLFKNIQLGRWKIDYCNKIINRKIDLANTDNCGKLYIDKTKHE